MILRALVTLVSGLPLLAFPVAAGAPERSLRPEVRQTGATVPVLRPRSRPGDVVQVTVSASVLPDASRAPHANDTTITTQPSVAAAEALVAIAALRPLARPTSEQVIAAGARPETLAFLSPDVSARPWPRPDSVVQEALFGKRKRRKGSVCGDIDIQGDKVGRVSGRIKACGIEDAVSVRSVSGVALSRPATMDCTTALALNEWVKKGVKPAFRRRGPVVELKVAAHYVCRTRNNQPGARISEHGRGRAIDISGFTMMDGEVVTVAKGWGQGTTLRPLRSAWKAACGPFGTVLGPNADRHHRDHFHMDTAQYRSGPYCK